MAQYGILIYSPAPADPTDLPPDYLELLDRYPAQVEELGGRIVTGFALQPSTTATTIRGGVVTDGPFVEVPGHGRGPLVSAENVPALRPGHRIDVHVDHPGGRTDLLGDLVDVALGRDGFTPQR